MNELFFEKYPAAVLEHQIQVRPFNAPQRHMRDLNPEGGKKYKFLYFYLFFYLFVLDLATLSNLYIIFTFCTHFTVRRYHTLYADCLFNSYCEHNEI